MPAEKPPISEVMTRNPHCIAHDEHVWKAKTTMQSLNIRHLPVLLGHRFLGIVSIRDLELAQQLCKQNGDSEITVEKICHSENYALSVSPSTPLDEALDKMAQHGLNAIAVIEGGDVVGIYTSVDVSRHFAQSLRGEGPV